MRTCAGLENEVPRVAHTSRLMRCVRAQKMKCIHALDAAS